MDWGKLLEEACKYGGIFLGNLIVVLWFKVKTKKEVKTEVKAETTASIKAETKGEVKAAISGELETRLKAQEEQIASLTSELEKQKKANLDQAMYFETELNKQKGANKLMNEWLDEAQQERQAARDERDRVEKRNIQLEEKLNAALKDVQTLRFELNIYKTEVEGNVAQLDQHLKVRLDRIERSTGELRQQIDNNGS